MIVLYKYWRCIFRYILGEVYMYMLAHNLTVS